MPATISLGSISLSTFAFALLLGAGASVIAARRRLDTPQSLGALIDLLLAAFVGAILGARLFHVLIEWDYFAQHLNEAFNLRAGGLDWHGALIGGLIGLAIMARVRRRALRPLLDALAPVLPLLMLAGWIGCAGAACGYGAEVATLADYPPLVTVETRDVFGIVAPRWNTHLFGVVLALLMVVLAWRLRHFGLVLLLVSAAMLGLSAVRGDDPVIALDIVFILIGILLTIVGRN